MAEKNKEEKAGKQPKKAKGAGKAKKASNVKVAGAGETRVSPSMKVPRLAKKYKEEVVAKLVKEFEFNNAMQVPRLKKIVLNCAVKDAVGNPKVLDSTLDELALITGQKAVLTRAKKSIASFKVREGIPLGVRVTLRRARMWEFMDRLVNVALPQVRDFRGIKTNAFDGRGNYSLGIKEQIIFPEISYDKVEKITGMTITFETSAEKNEHARSLLQELGMPFKK